MPNWKDGLVEAFPVPEDRRPGWKKRKQKLKERESGSASSYDKTLEEVLSSLNLSSTVPAEPFRFFDLPSELRNRIYHAALFSKPEYRTASGMRPSRLSCLLASQQMHKEASYILYSTTRFNIFPIQLFEAPPTVLDLPSRYLPYIANLKMIVGSSWTSVPKSWRVTKTLARRLKRLTGIQTLRVFVEFDPSHPAFERYRISYDFYTDFCGDLLAEVLEVMPQLRYVELDGNPGVDVNGPLVSRLREESEEAEKDVRWGAQAGWAHKRVEELSHRTV